MTLAAILPALVVIALVYATVGQAGGTGFLAVLALGRVPVDELRPTALILNVVAASYSTWWLRHQHEMDWRLLALAAIPALPASFLGGLVALDGDIYYPLTALVLMFAAVMMVARWQARAIASPADMPFALSGMAAGFMSGVTGVGGGVFLAPVIIALGWVTARQAAALSAPFILGNSLTGLAGAWVAGQRPADDTGFYMAAALVGAMSGTLIGQRFMSERATRLMLAAILVLASLHLLHR